MHCCLLGDYSDMCRRTSLILGKRGTSNEPLAFLHGAAARSFGNASQGAWTAMTPWRVMPICSDRDQQRSGCSNSGPRRQSGINPVSYRADIDGMRAVAILLVLVFHFSLVPGGKAGF